MLDPGGAPAAHAVHPCFGNYGGRPIQRGTWAGLIHHLNGLHADHIVMENAHRPAEELAVFRGLRPEIGLGLGVADIKRTGIEGADDIARAIERADAVPGPGAGSAATSTRGLRLPDAAAGRVADGRQDPRPGRAGRDPHEGRGAAARRAGAA